MPESSVRRRRPDRPPTPRARLQHRESLVGISLWMHNFSFHLSGAACITLSPRGFLATTGSSPSASSTPSPHSLPSTFYAHRRTSTISVFTSADGDHHQPSALRPKPSARPPRPAPITAHPASLDQPPVSRRPTPSRSIRKSVCALAVFLREQNIVGLVRSSLVRPTSTASQHRAIPIEHWPLERPAPGASDHPEPTAPLARRRLRRRSLPNIFSSFSSASSASSASTCSTLGSQPAPPPPTTCSMIHAHTLRTDLAEPRRGASSARSNVRRAS